MLAGCTAVVQKASFEKKQSLFGYRVDAGRVDKDDLI